MTVPDPDPDAVPRTRLASPQRSDPLRRRRIAAGISVLVHAIAIAILLFAIPPPPVELSADPAVEIVYENASSPAPSTSPVTDTNRPAAEQVPERPAPPDPVPPGPAPPAPKPVPVEPPAPDAQPVPTPPEVVPPAPEPPPPEPEPATRSVPVVRLEAPPTSEPAPPVPEFQPPTPPPPLPPLPRPPAPRRLVERPRAPPGFPPPIDLSFGPAPSAPPSRSLAGPGSRAVDLALGAPKPGPNRQEAFYDARAKKIGADWANGLTAWWLAHRYYPRQAVESGEDGTVKVELTVNRSGRVEEVTVINRSGSPFLDMAALSVWRGAQLAPFPAENSKQRETMEITINYLLIR